MDCVQHITPCLHEGLTYLCTHSAPLCLFLQTMRTHQRTDCHLTGVLLLVIFHLAQALLERMSACTTSSLLAASGPTDTPTPPLPASCLAALQRAWPRAAAALLLHLAQADPLYTSRRYFTGPLAECEYQDLHVDTSAGGGATFASTQFYGATQVGAAASAQPDVCLAALHLPARESNICTTYPWQHIHGCFAYPTLVMPSMSGSCCQQSLTMNHALPFLLNTHPGAHQHLQGYPRHHCFPEGAWCWLCAGHAHCWSHPGTQQCADCAAVIGVGCWRARWRAGSCFSGGAGAKGSRSVHGTHVCPCLRWHSL